MKRYLFTLCYSLALLSNNLLAGNLTAYLTYATFNIPAKEPYIETYLSVIGNSVKFIKNANGKYQGAVDITINFKQNGEIKNAQKYTLNSQEVNDTLKDFPNFIDQQRYTLVNGAYDVELTIADKNKQPDKPFNTSFPLNINFTDDKVSISDIQLLESYTKSTTTSVLTKSGYDLIPYTSTYYPDNFNKIKMYAEVYCAKKIIGEGQKVLINYFLEAAETRIKLNNFSSFSRQIANDVNVLLTEFDIKSLPTGKYNLVIELRDKDNKIQAEQKCPIQRQNEQATFSIDNLQTIDVNTTFVSSYKNLDTLAEYIRCLRPISSSSAIRFSENQLKGGNLVLMQQFFYNFWKSRNEKEPQLTWLEYYKEVMKANREFGTLSLKGYNTDRGRVYLQYGSPNSRNVVNNELGTLPYEIWQYDVLIDNSQTFAKQANKLFVFYNSELAGNRYRLAHSTAQGELHNNNWQSLIRNNKVNNWNSDPTQNNFGDNADDNFRNPK